MVNSSSPPPMLNIQSFGGIFFHPPEMKITGQRKEQVRGGKKVVNYAPPTLKAIFKTTLTTEKWKTD